MAANTPREVVVEIDGLHFRIQKLKGRRAFRGTRALQTSLGLQGYLMISSPKFWEAKEGDQLTALLQVESKTGASYDDAEQAIVELLAYSGGSRGQGVCYRETAPDPDKPGKGWMPITSMETIDTYDQVDHMTWQALRWEMIKLGYRPTSAATGTSAGTPAAATTSTQARSPGGAAQTQQPGTPKAASPVLGCSGG